MDVLSDCLIGPPYLGKGRVYPVTAPGRALLCLVTSDRWRSWRRSSQRRPPAPGLLGKRCVSVPGFPSSFLSKHSMNFTETYRLLDGRNAICQYSHPPN